MSPTNTFKPSNRSAATAGRQSERIYRPLTRSRPASARHTRSPDRASNLGRRRLRWPLSLGHSGWWAQAHRPVVLGRQEQHRATASVSRHLGRIVLVNIDTGGAASGGRRAAYLREHHPEMAEQFRDTKESRCHRQAPAVHRSSRATVPTTARLNIGHDGAGPIRPRIVPLFAPAVVDMGISRPPIF